MISNLLQKVLVSTVVGTVIGFSTILGAIGSASALTVDSPEPQRGPTKDISNMVFYLQDNSGDITEVKKVKVDSVSGTKSYDATNFLKTYYPDYEVVAYTVKAGNNFSGMGPGEGELFILDNQVAQGDLPTGAVHETYQYSQVSNLPAPEAPTPEPENSNPDNQEPAPDTNPGKPTFVEVEEPSEKKVKVPEPGSIAAIAIFGLGGLLRKKKASS